MAQPGAGQHGEGEEPRRLDGVGGHRRRRSASMATLACWAAQACHTAAAHAAPPRRGRPPRRPWRRPRPRGTPISPRCDRAWAEAAMKGRACPSAGARLEPRHRRRCGPAPGASRPGRRRPRWAERRPPRVGRAGRRRHPRSAGGSRAPAPGGAARSPESHRTAASTPVRRSCADPTACRCQAAAARAGGRAAHGTRLAPASRPRPATASTPCHAAAWSNSCPHNANARTSRTSETRSH
jgi:hypothetical protein